MLRSSQAPGDDSNADEDGNEIEMLGNASGRRACEFGLFFRYTPAPLLKAGMYSKIAKVAKGGRLRDVSLLILLHGIAEFPLRQEPIIVDGVVLDAAIVPSLPEQPPTDDVSALAVDENAVLPDSLIPHAEQVPQTEQAPQAAVFQKSWQLNIPDTPAAAAPVAAEQTSLSLPKAMSALRFMDMLSPTPSEAAKSESTSSKGARNAAEPLIGEATERTAPREESEARTILRERAATLFEGDDLSV